MSFAVSRRNFISAALLAAGAVTSQRSKAGADPEAPRQGHTLTVATCLELTRAMSGAAGASRTADDGTTVFVSPDGQRYVVILISGDVERDGNWAEVICGGLTSLPEAAPRTVARLFTRGLGNAAMLTWDIFNTPVWYADNRRIVLFWEDDAGVRQAIEIDTTSTRVRFLTDHPTDVVSFDVSAHGDIAYCAQVPRSRSFADKLIADGFSVTNVDGWSLASGDVDGYSLYDRELNTEWFVRRRGEGAARKVAMPGGQINRFNSYFRTVFSHDGRRAIIESSPASIPPTWRVYTDPFLRSKIDATLQGLPNSDRLVRQLMLLDVDQATARPLLDAPVSTRTNSRVAWSNGGERLLVGPVYLLPEGADAAALDGNAVVEVDLENGIIRRLPMRPEVVATGIRQIQWPREDLAQITTGDATWQFTRAQGQWRPLGRAATTTAEMYRGRVAVAFRQDLNTPPVLVAQDQATGRRRVVRDLNPGLTDRFRFGHAELIEWTDRMRQSWKGVLYRPANRESGRRCPLVIQSRGPLPVGEFSVYGPGGRSPALGPGYVAYAARVLAGRGMCVVQIEDKPVSRASATAIADEPERYMHGYEAAARYLIAAGLAEPTQVGLMGFSRSAWRVAYALANSEFPYAAAITADGLSGGYVEAALLGWSLEYADELHGAPPFGEGLEVWMKNAPPFSADRIRTPLQIQHGSGGLRQALSQWEMFSRLRRLRRPVELYVIPNIEKAIHGIQNPRQSLASQERAVDWWEFWLRGVEDPAQRKVSQYEAWRHLRDQQAAAVDSAGGASVR